MHSPESLLEGAAGKVVNGLQIEQTDTKRFEIIRYGILCFLGEVTKFAILLALFAFAQKLMSFLISCCTLVAVRIYIGGTHCHTWAGCFFRSLFAFVTVLLLNQNIGFSLNMVYVVYLILVVWIWKTAPLVSSNRASYNSYQRMRFKAKAITVLLILLVLMIMLPKEMAGNIIWTVIVVWFDAVIAETNEIMKGGEQCEKV